MLPSDSLLYFCPYLVLKHAEFLLRFISLYKGNSRLSRRKFRASNLRPAPGYRRNDITVLITGDPNTNK